MKEAGCLARRVGDQIRCGQCALVWDANDPEPPPCGREPVKQIDPLTVIRNLVDAVEDLLKHYGDIHNGQPGRSKEMAYVRAKAAINQGKALL